MLRDFKKFTAIAVICTSVFMYASASESASSAFVEACKSYSRGDWSDAKFMLKKAVSYKENLNPDSLKTVQAYVEPSLAAAEKGGRWQFERLGYFYADPKDSKENAPVFNRIVTLKDTWAKVAKKN